MTETQPNYRLSSFYIFLVFYSQGEVQILDYQAQQHKLFPLLAASYCYYFVSQKLMEFYKSSESAIQAGDFSQLPEVSPKAGYVYLVKSFWPICGSTA